MFNQLLLTNIQWQSPCFSGGSEHTYVVNSLLPGTLSAKDPDAQTTQLKCCVMIVLPWSPTTTSDCTLALPDHHRQRKHYLYYDEQSPLNYAARSHSVISRLRLSSLDLNRDGVPTELEPCLRRLFWPKPKLPSL